MSDWNMDWRLILGSSYIHMQKYWHLTKTALDHYSCFLIGILVRLGLDV